MGMACGPLVPCQHADLHSWLNLPRVQVSTVANSSKMAYSMQVTLLSAAGFSACTWLPVKSSQNQARTGSSFAPPFPLYLSVFQPGRFDF